MDLSGYNNLFSESLLILQIAECFRCMDVTFKPTESQYSFVLLADRGCLSPRASVRHRKTGDTGDYASGDVEATAFRVACAAIKSSRD
jgi:hypothetical protein